MEAHKPCTQSVSGCSSEGLTQKEPEGKKGQDASWAELTWLGLFVQNHSANLCAECQGHVHQKCALRVSQGHSSPLVLLDLNCRI